MPRNDNADANFDGASQASSRRSRASGVGMGVANTSKPLVFSEPTMTHFFNKVFPIFPILLPISNRAPQLVSAVGMLIFIFQNWGLVLNPYFDSAWGTILGGDISSMFYGFLFTVYDPILVPSATVVPMLILNYIFLVLGVTTVVLILYHLKAKEDAQGEAKTTGSGVVRMILQIVSGPLLLPITVLSFASMVCDNSGYLWMYSEGSVTKCWSGAHLASFFPGLVNLVIFVPLAYITTVCVYQYSPLSDDFLAKRHSFMDKLTFFSNVGSAALFSICLGLNVTSIYAFIHFALCVILVGGYMIMLPYYEMNVNRFYVGVHSMEAVGSLFVGISIVNYEFESYELTSVLFLGLGVVVSLFLVLFTDWRVNPSFYVEMQKALHCVNFFTPKDDEADIQPDDVDDEEDEEKDEAAVFKVSDEEVMKLPYPTGLASSMDFSPYTSLNTQVVESIARQSLNNLLTGGKVQKRSAYPVLQPFIRHCFNCYDPCVAVSYLDLYARTFGMGEVNEMMLLFAANIYGRAQCTFIREPFVLICFTSFITTYLPGLSFMGVDLLKLVVHNRCSLEEQFRVLKQANDLRTALGIRSHAHTIRSAKARTTHGKILQLIGRFWVKLTEPSVNIKEVAEVADKIRNYRRSAIEQFDQALLQQQSVDPVLLKRLGDFFSQVLMSADAAQECYSEAKDIYDMRQARSMRGTRQHGVEVDLASHTERMRHLLYFHSEGGALSSKATASVFIQIFSIVLVIIFGLLVSICALQIYLISVMMNSLSELLHGIDYITQLWLYSLELGGIIAGLGLDISQEKLDEIIVNNVVLDFLNAFKVAALTDVAGSLGSRAKRELMTRFTIPFYSSVQENDYGFSLWGLSENFVQAVARYFSDSGSYISMATANYNRQYVVQSASIIGKSYERYLDLETHDTVWKMTTRWAILLIMLFLLSGMLLAVAYSSIIYIFERTSLGRVFTFQLFTLIPYDSLEKLATEARERYHQIHMEKTIRGTAATEAENARADEMKRNEVVERTNNTIQTYAVANDVPLISCMKKTERTAGSPIFSKNSASPKPRKQVTFNSVVEVVGGSDAKKDTKKKKEEVAQFVPKAKAKRKAEGGAHGLGGSSVAIGFFIALFTTILIGFAGSALCLGFSLIQISSSEREINGLFFTQSTIGQAFLSVPLGFEGAVRYIASGSSVSFENSQVDIISAIVSIPNLMGTYVPSEQIPNLVEMHKSVQEILNVTIDAAVLASHSFPSDLSHFGNAYTLSQYTEAELIELLKAKYPKNYAKSELIFAGPGSQVDANTVFAGVILSENVVPSLYTFFSKGVEVLDSLIEYQVSLLRTANILVIAALIFSCVPTVFALVLAVTPLRRFANKYISGAYLTGVIISFLGVIIGCIGLLVSSSRLEEHFVPHAKAINALSKMLFEGIMLCVYQQGFVLNANPLYWFNSGNYWIYPIAKEISEYLAENFLGAEATEAFMLLRNGLWELNHLNNVSAALGISSLDTVMLVEVPMETALKNSHWDFSAEKNYEFKKAWFGDEPYYTDKASDLLLDKEDQYDIARAVVTGAQYSSVIQQCEDGWKRLETVFIEKERENFTRAMSLDKTIVYITFGFCAVPALFVVYTIIKLGKALSKALVSNTNSKTTSSDHFKYKSMLRRALFALLLLSIFYATTFGVGIWYTQIGISFSEQLLVAARQEASTANSVFSLRKLISGELSFTLPQSVIEDRNRLGSDLTEQFSHRSSRGVKIGLSASTELDEYMFGQTKSEEMKEIFASFLRNRCFRYLGGNEKPDEAVENYIKLDSLRTTIAGATLGWVTNTTRIINVVEDYSATRERMIATLSSSTGSVIPLLVAHEDVNDLLVIAFLDRNSSIGDVLLGLSIVSLLMTVVVFGLVGIPTIYRLLDEQSAVKTLLQIIPANIRDEVPAIQQHVETGQISASSELYKKFEQNEKLLQNILPQKIANRLKKGEQPIADTHDCVTILFTDFVGFTKRSSTMQADEIVEFLNEVFLEFDTVVELLALEKIKTIGDAFFMAGGLDQSVSDHALRVVEAGLMFFDALDEHNKRHPNRAPLQMRLGVHSGPVVAGVIGIKKVAYDLWGESVEIANAMESTGVPGFVHISETTAAFVRGIFRLAPRGELPREKEHIPDNMPKTFLVVGRELPTPYMHLRRPRLMPTNLGAKRKP